MCIVVSHNVFFCLWYFNKYFQQIRLWLYHSQAGFDLLRCCRGSGGEGWGRGGRSLFFPCPRSTFLPSIPSLSFLVKVVIICDLFVFDEYHLQVLVDWLIDWLIDQSRGRGEGSSSRNSNTVHESWRIPLSVFSFDFCCRFLHYSELCFGGRRSVVARVDGNSVALASPSNVAFVVSPFNRWRCGRRGSRCARYSGPPGSRSPVRPLCHAGLERTGAARGVANHRIHSLLERVLFRQVGVSKSK